MGVGSLDNKIVALPPRAGPGSIVVLGAARFVVEELPVVEVVASLAAPLEQADTRSTAITTAVNPAIEPVLAKQLGNCPARSRLIVDPLLCDDAFIKGVLYFFHFGNRVGDFNQRCGGITSGQNHADISRSIY